MCSAVSIVHFYVTVIIAGLLGATAMQSTMWLISRAGWAKGNMVVALGGLFTRSRASAGRVGAILHAIWAMIFSILYALVIERTHATAISEIFALGLGIGFFHGMIVSIMLVYVVAEHHPLEEFKEADLAIGLSHLVGHVVFGGVVGLVVGISML